jgi:hypothetical protein
MSRSANQLSGLFRNLDLPKRRSCIDCFQGLRTLGQIQNVQLLIPDVDKAKLVSGHVVKWALEQGTCYIDIGLATRNGEIAPFVYN